MATWNEVGNGVFVRRYESLALSIGAVLGDDGVLVVDSRASHDQARELIKDLSVLTKLPVRWVVNTHYHWDHCWGNAVFRAAELWGHVNTRRHLLEDGEQARRRVIAQLPVEYHEVVREVEIVAPEHTFSEQVSLDIGRAVDLKYHGRGHTDSDITVGAGDVLFAGDLIEQAAPPSFDDSFPLDWPSALDGLLECATGPVIPGHGDPVDRAFVVQQRDDIAGTIDLARAGFEAGLPARDVNVTVAPFPAHVARLVVERAYAQLGGDI
jgi:glyoxylase-like metal-dependent hydrolase (beta-lactamase superfamily II)